MGTLPSGYKPTYDVCAAGDGKSNNLGQMIVYSTGEVRLWLFGGTSQFFAGEVVYLLSPQQ